MVPRNNRKVGVTKKAKDLSTVIVIPIGDTAAAVVCGCVCTHDGYKVTNPVLVVVL